MSVTKGYFSKLISVIAMLYRTGVCGAQLLDIENSKYDSSIFVTSLMGTTTAELMCTESQTWDSDNSKLL